MFLFARVFFLSLLILIIIFTNLKEMEFTFLFMQIKLPAAYVILGSALLGYLLNRWYGEYRQINLIEIVKEYSKKVTSLENELARREKEHKQGPTN